MGSPSQKKKPLGEKTTPLEASLSKPSGGALSWPSQEGSGYTEGRPNFGFAENKNEDRPF
jgi:hypothetical protein